ncbi:BON domain-containing protein [Rhizobium sp. C4]|uniref:BON domain-containing protein n=1 Tax=Rhizobium sp. C4 TaxID=1349800 RepID=UPI001E4CCA64|nr:BON domain-containing protein [Rhizobium sp. C4]MCD2173554.1 BON domain-containing protein [Rhizobium sp. C4]
MAERKSPPETDREEDYRDYDKRNIGEGWPYADEDGLPADRNAPYGTTGSNFDESGRAGVEIGNRPNISSHGGPEISDAGEGGVIEDDVLEEKITELLSENENFDMRLITVTVHEGVAVLSGDVETEHARVLASRLTTSVRGVRRCRNDLVLIGADSHIPSDSDI